MIFRDEFFFSLSETYCKSWPTTILKRAEYTKENGSYLWNHLTYRDLFYIFINVHIQKRAWYLLLVFSVNSWWWCKPSLPGWLNRLRHCHCSTASFAGSSPTWGGRLVTDAGDQQLFEPREWGLRVDLSGHFCMSITDLEAKIKTKKTNDVSLYFITIWDGRSCIICWRNGLVMLEYWISNHNFNTHFFMTHCVQNYTENHKWNVVIVIHNLICMY